MVLNDRELAIAFWIVVAAAYFLRNPDIRNQSRTLLEALLSKHILILTLCFFAWVVFSVSALSRFGILGDSSFKLILYWSFFTLVAFVYFIKVEASNRFLIKFWSIETFSVVTVVAFILSFHIFPVYVEFILQPFLFFIGMVLVFSQSKKDYVVVNNIFTFLLAGIVLTMLYFSVRSLVVADSVTWLRFLSDIVMPFLLNFLLLPFLLILNAALYFERQVVSLRRIGVIENWSFSLVGNIFLSFGLSLSHFDRWIRFVRIHRPSNDEEVVGSIREISRNIRDQAYWRVRCSQSGWSPFNLMNAISMYGLRINFYDRHLLDWYGVSRSLTCEAESKLNSIQISMSGDRACVKEVSLVMDVVEADKCEEIVLLFEKCANKLLQIFFHERLNFSAQNFEIQGETAIATLKTSYRGMGNEFATRELTLVRK